MAVTTICSPSSPTAFFTTSFAASFVAALANVLVTALLILFTAFPRASLAPDTFITPALAPAIKADFSGSTPDITPPTIPAEAAAAI